MEATFRRTLFPVSKSHKSQQQHQILKAGHDYISNLPLQMAIYFNAFFTPFWIAIIVVSLETKYVYLPVLYKITLLAVYLVYMIIEIIRLYLGYLGNLMERVPELAG